MMLAAFTACDNNTNKEADQENDAKGSKAATIKTEYDSLAYCYGVMFGTQYSNFPDKDAVVPGESMNLETFLAAFNTAIRRDTTHLKISPEQAQAFLQHFQMKMQQKMMEEQEAKKKENLEKGKAFMAENAKKEGVKTLPSGLQIQTITEGTGKKPTMNNTVKVNYKGTLIDGTVFDQNKEIEFPLNGVVKGFSEGIMNMREGGKAILTFPSELGYGEYGSGRLIEGGATLQFEVELLKITK